MYAINIEVELEDVSDSNTINTIDNNIDFVGKLRPLLLGSRGIIIF
jgi:hypothetical protein